jgi:hypothetical protein
VLGGDGERGAKTEREGVHGGGHALAAFGFVGDEKNGNVLAAEPGGEVAVGRGDTGACIDDEDDDGGLSDGGLGRGAHPAEQGFGSGLFETRGVDEADVAAAQAGFGLLAVAGDAGFVGDQRRAAAGQAVEERGFADVGAARDDDDREGEFKVGQR